MKRSPTGISEPPQKRKRQLQYSGPKPGYTQTEWKESRGTFRSYKDFFSSNITTRMPCLVTGFGRTGVDRVRYFMFEEAMKRLDPEERIHMKSGLIPIWWKDTESVIKYSKLNADKRLTQEDIDKIMEVEYEVEGKEGEESTVKSASFHDFLSNLSPGESLAPQSVPTKSKITISGDLSYALDVYNTSPLSLLSLNQATVVRDAFVPSEDGSNEFGFPKLISKGLKMMMSKSGHGLKVRKTDLSIGKTSRDGCKSGGLRVDDVDAVILVLRGYKRIRLIAPEEKSKCYFGDSEGMDGEGDYVEEKEDEDEKDDGKGASKGEGEAKEKEEEKMDDEDDEEEVTIGKGFDYTSETDDFPAPPKATFPLFSDVDPNLEPDEIASKFPDFASVKQNVYDVGAGQCLFIPAGWIYEVRTYGWKPEEWKGLCDQFEESTRIAMEGGAKEATVNDDVGMVEEAEETEDTEKKNEEPKAEEPTAVPNFSKMKVAELRVECENRGLLTKGLKAVLVERLQEYTEREEESVPETEKKPEPKEEKTETEENPIEVEKEISELEPTGIVEAGFHVAIKWSYKPPLDASEFETPYKAGSAKAMFKMLFPTSIMGSLIGQKGANLKSIESGCQIEMKAAASKPNQYGHSGYFPGTYKQVVAMQGTTSGLKKAVCEALKVYDFYHNRNLTQDRLPQSQPMYPDFFVCEIALPMRLMGFTLGKGGATIQKISKESNCFLQCHPYVPDEKNPRPSHHEKRMTIKSKESNKTWEDKINAVKNAICLILDLQATKITDPAYKYLVAYEKEILYPPIPPSESEIQREMKAIESHRLRRAGKEYNPRCGPSGGPPPPSQGLYGNQGGGNRGGNNAPPPGFESSRSPYGYPPQHAPPSHQYQQSSPPSYQSRGGALPPPGYPLQPHQGHAPPQRFQQPPQQPYNSGMPPQQQYTGPKEEEKVSVPNEFIGAIMGHGGSVINEIKAMSQCGIHISDKDDMLKKGQTDRIVTITGTVEGRNQAKIIMQGRVGDAMAKKQAAQMRGGGGYQPQQHMGGGGYQPQQQHMGGSGYQPQQQQMGGGGYQPRQHQMGGRGGGGGYQYGQQQHGQYPG
eukprot:CAMPEP_0118664804 /NCGR_PEP_ID=MMETSP0785-20121206/18234_1 /TAXON_ID=91992 /ORGANISM="Bolidomonas pacifica, Strain CCMP 1866" /LENGTH=1087 /DNA_ID=CAMNT_0006558787 /DNA_START=58 /DNA_END=3317 /DNA_ORIENTATION=-